MPPACLSTASLLCPWAASLSGLSPVETDLLSWNSRFGLVFAVGNCCIEELCCWIMCVYGCCYKWNFWVKPARFKLQLHHGAVLFLFCFFTYQIGKFPEPRFLDCIGEMVGTRPVKVSIRPKNRSACKSRGWGQCLREGGCRSAAGDLPTVQAEGHFLC